MGVLGWAEGEHECHLPVPRLIDDFLEEDQLSTNLLWKCDDCETIWILTEYWENYSNMEVWRVYEPYKHGKILPYYK